MRGSGWRSALTRGSFAPSTGALERLAPSNSPGNAVYDYYGYGPTYGAGFDMYTCGYCNSMQIVYTSPSSYVPIGTVSNTYDGNFLAGGSSISLSEIEVYVPVT